jgi:hypothetical protein
MRCAAARVDLIWFDLMAERRGRIGAGVERVDVLWWGRGREGKGFDWWWLVRDALVWIMVTWFEIRRKAIDV